MTSVARYPLSLRGIMPETQVGCETTMWQFFETLGRASYTRYTRMCHLTGMVWRKINRAWPRYIMTHFTHIAEIACPGGPYTIQFLECYLYFELSVGCTLFSQFGRYSMPRSSNWLWGHLFGDELTEYHSSNCQFKVQMSFRELMAWGAIWQNAS